MINCISPIVPNIELIALCLTVSHDLENVYFQQTELDIVT